LVVVVTVVVILITKLPATTPGTQSTAPLPVRQMGIARACEAKTLSAASSFTLFLSARWDVVVAFVSVFVLVLVSAQQLGSRERCQTSGRTRG